jgi:hypothetical protein
MVPTECLVVEDMTATSNRNVVPFLVGQNTRIGLSTACCCKTVNRRASRVCAYAKSFKPLGLATP